MEKWTLRATFPATNSMKPTVAIIGCAGKLGSRLARNLSQAGYPLSLVARQATEASATMETIRSVHPFGDIEVFDSPRDACWDSDIVIPAVPYTVQAAIAGRIREVASGKIVISVANPEFEPIGGLTGFPTSAAEELASLLPHSKIVKAFNTTFAQTFDRRDLSEKDVDCFVAGDDEQAVRTVSLLVKETGFNPVVAGKLAVSRTLENMMAMLIRLDRNLDAHGFAGWKVIHHPGYAKEPAV